jgi:hypothetical protein
LRSESEAKSSRFCAKRSEAKRIRINIIRINLNNLSIPLPYSAENSSLISNLILSFLNSSSWKTSFSLAAASFYQPLFLPDF